jgi:integrase
MSTKKITELALRELKPKKRLTDTHIKGFVARCLPSGEINFGLQYTDKASGKRKWFGIGLHGNVTVDKARELAEEARGRIAGGDDPAGELKTTRARAVNSVDHVLDQYLKIHVAKHCRGARAIEGNLAKHARPVIGNRIIYDLKRSDMTKLEDKIAEDSKRMPGIVLAYLRAAFNFWEKRDDEFKNPIARGSVKDETKTRTRVLTPDELRDIWRALDELEHVPATFAAYVKVLLLTCCRRSEVGDMHTDEIVGDRWVIPAARYKTDIDMVVPLIPAIKKLLPKIKNGFVFGCASHRHDQAAGAKPLRGYHKAKAALDKAIAEIRKREGRPAMKPWTFHDLRRTARTWLAELGVSSEIAERCLGHTSGKIEDTYNQHRYLKEKAEALSKLAVHVDKIVHARTPAAAPKLRLVAG